jgi:hypothetical protein
MGDGPETSNLIDHFTRFVKRQVSRRGFLKAAGSVGLALAAPLAGINRLLQQSPLVPTCPPICVGVCSCAASDCITGGFACSLVCGPVPCDCDPLCIKAVGAWDWSFELNKCVFSCASVPCSC